ncbi:MAG TPA: SEC-C domain-containing protein [Thermodesulfobacteriota bacterium]|nr:SEC-C domain-containing protein [Thermodesulfobacteriota bacterium]
MKNLDESCTCGSGKRFRDCCYHNDSVVDLTQYKFDQADKELRMKIVDFSHRPDIQAQIGEAFYIWKNDPEILNENILEDDIDDLMFSKFFDWFIHDFKLLDDGKRVIERFYEEERKYLSEVEDQILNDWMDNLYSFFEVEEVFPKKGCRVRDIFSGELIEVKDTASSERISTSDIIAGRPLKTGNNYYFSGVILVYPSSFKPLIIDFFNREFKEYKKVFGRKSTSKDYLKDWGFLMGNYLEDALKHQRFLTPEGDDLVLASATYDLKNYDRALGNLRKVNSLQEMAGGTDELRMFSWLRADKSTIYGTIELEKDKLRIECYSANILSKAKNLVEKRLKGLVVHEGDKIRQLESLMPKGKSGRPSKANKKSRARNKVEVNPVLDRYYEDWIDKPLKVLQGKTPRQAMQTRQGRDKLNSILDELQNLYEHARERGEPYYDVSKLRKKLRLE